ncbi:MAG: YceI family protein [Pseudomonadota bacterium]
MRLTNTSLTYGLIHQMFHWATAVLIISLFAIAKYMDWLPTNSAEEVSEKVWWYSLHKTVGITLFAVAIGRVVWTLIQPHPKLLNDGLEAFAARTVHWLLYGSIIAMPMLGWLHHAASEGYAPIWWPFGQNLPFIPKDVALSAFFGNAHHHMGFVLVGAILLHIAGAIKHAVIDKDATLQRMVPGANLPMQSALAASVPSIPGTKTVPAALAGVVFLTVFGVTAILYSPLKTAPVVAAEPATVSKGGWVIDQAKSTLAIEITQLGAPVRGAFQNWSADVVFDPENPEAATITATIDMASLSIGDVSERARSAEFLDAPQFPTATFKAETVAKTDAGFEADGTLTLAGIEQPLKLPFTFREENGRAFVTAEAALARLDFQVGKTFPDSSSVGETVKVLITLEATRSE